MAYIIKRKERGNKGKDIQYVINENDCWICISHCAGNRGYPHLQIYGKTILISRYIYGRFRGPIPEGLCVCHTCDNTLCINPFHLWVGTNGDNTRDAIKKGRWADHKGEKNEMAKLTSDIVLTIKDLIDEGMDKKHIAEKFNISLPTIYRIKMQTTWMHLWEE